MNSVTGVLVMTGGRLPSDVAWKLCVSNPPRPSLTRTTKGYSPGEAEKLIRPWLSIVAPGGAVVRA